MRIAIRHKVAQFRLKCVAYYLPGLVGRGLLLYTYLEQDFDYFTCYGREFGQVVLLLLQLLLVVFGVGVLLSESVQ